MSIDLNNAEGYSVSNDEDYKHTCNHLYIIVQ